MAEDDPFESAALCHYTSAGYAIRGQQIAEGLAKAFPAKGHRTGWVVS